MASRRHGRGVGCTVEASYRASGSLVVREQRLWQGATLLAESYVTFVVP